MVPKSLRLLSVNNINSTKKLTSSTLRTTCPFKLLKFSLTILMTFLELLNMPKRSATLKSGASLLMLTLTDLTLLKLLIATLRPRITLCTSKLSALLKLMVNMNNSLSILPWLVKTLRMLKSIMLSFSPSLRLIRLPNSKTSSLVLTPLTTNALVIVVTMKSTTKLLNSSSLPPRTTLRLLLVSLDLNNSNRLLMLLRRPTPPRLGRN